MKQIDSIQPPARREAIVRQPVQPRTGARFTALTATHKRRMAQGVISTVALSPLLCGLALLSVIGMGVVVIYGVVAIVRRLPSRTSFILALAAFVYMVILQLADAEAIAQNMAVLAYILLAIGVISLALEVKMSSQMWFKKH